MAVCPGPSVLPPLRLGRNEAAVLGSRGKLSVAGSKAVPRLGLVLLLEKTILFKPFHFGVSVNVV